MAMAFEHRNRGAGDVILSADWNAMGDEIQRVGQLLEQDEKKQTVTLPVALRVFGKGSPRSPLSVAGGAAIGSGYADKSAAPANGLIVEGSTGVGTPSPKAKLHVVHQEQDAGGNALVLGPDTGSNLRLGYHKDYSWIQSHGSRPLKINPQGSDVSIGAQMVVQGDGDVGIGTQAPQARLHVEGSQVLNGGLTVRDSVQFVNKTRQMLNLWGQEYGIGVQGSTQYYRSAGHFAWYKGGKHDDAVLNAGGGAPQMVLRDNGFLGIGTAEPTHRFHVRAADEVGLFESTGGQAYLRVSTKEGLENRVELANRPGGRLALWVAGGSDAFNVTRDGNVGIRTTTPRSDLDLAKGVMSGAPNDYAKAQYTLSGGGVVSWGGTGARVKWTNRFIAIAMERGTSFADGHVNLYMPAEIPLANVHDGTARASKDGVVLKHWEALYAVHTPGANPGDVSYQLVYYGKAFSAPSNWILVAVCNGDDGSLKLGNGATLPPMSSLAAAGDVWEPAPFQNGWTNYGGNFNPGGYYKDALGIVHLRGLIKNQKVIDEYSRHPEIVRATIRVQLIQQFVGWDKPPIFQLPGGLRPPHRELRVAIANESIIARVDIDTDGQIRVVAGSIEWLSLDGITFRAA
jgi:hypothetical protein